MSQWPDQAGSVPHSSLMGQLPSPSCVSLVVHAETKHDSIVPLRETCCLASSIAQPPQGHMQSSMSSQAVVTFLKLCEAQEHWKQQEMQVKALQAELDATKETLRLCMAEQRKKHQLQGEDEAASTTVSTTTETTMHEQDASFSSTGSSGSISRLQELRRQQRYRESVIMQYTAFQRSFCGATETIQQSPGEKDELLVHVQEELRKSEQANTELLVEVDSLKCKVSKADQQIAKMEQEKGSLLALREEIKQTRNEDKQKDYTIKELRKMLYFARRRFEDAEAMVEQRETMLSRMTQLLKEAKIHEPTSQEWLEKSLSSESQEQTHQ